ncbi:hypothetical protein BDZ97DRAFT_1145767 [Flammula alnicola]|nr:hypothetical protein BDZ97DRAFT_1145767 [Flammula alnicola]
MFCSVALSILFEVFHLTLGSRSIHLQRGAPYLRSDELWSGSNRLLRLREQRQPAIEYSNHGHAMTHLHGRHTARHRTAHSSFHLPLLWAPEYVSLVHCIAHSARERRAAASTYGTRPNAASLQSPASRKPKHGLHEDER